VPARPEPERAPDDDRGLTTDEVARRVAAGQVNRSDDRTSRSFASIVRANVFTRFNAILAVLNLAVLSTGRLADATFGLVFFFNTVIGVGQEVRAKRTLDRLAILHAPTCHVRRAEGAVEVPVDQVVLDDLVDLRPGDQVPADGKLVGTEGLEVDESLLTGESGAVAKAAGEDVLSGSFVVAGRGLARAVAVGPDSYAQRLAADARRFALTRSEMREAINQILRVITWVMAVVAPLIIWSQWRTTADWRTAVAGAVAALAGMVPEGLVLLTSLTMMVAAAALARRQVLIQELAAVEGLARVDVVCLDKTGTLTDGRLRLEGVEPVGGDTDGADGADGEATDALAALAARPDANTTMQAIAAALDDPGWTASEATPFSSARKWSAATFEGHGTWVLGAPEIVGAAAGGPAGEARAAGSGPGGEKVVARAEELAAAGRRVLLVARASGPVTGGRLPGDLRPAALCLLSEQVRPDAEEILRYFGDQGVTLKLISGDHPVAVAAVAARAGLSTGESIDARQLPDEGDDGADEALAELAGRHDVFGRVTPEQKRRLVRALQRRGHTVAMTGDGVNDALALKEADIGVAMGSGSAATRSVAQMVLLDDSFARLPHVVSEGRRVINNVERVANLYLTKNAYSLVMTLAVVMAGVAYPFLPRQLTLITAVTYGIPSVFLALAPQKGRNRPGFLGRLLRFALPAGVLTAAAILGARALAEAEGATVEAARAASVIAAVTTGLGVLCLVARPLRPWKLALVATMAAVAAVALSLPPVTRFLELHVERAAVIGGLTAGVAGAAAVAVVTSLWTRFGDPAERHRA
jgi:cation-transporting ATPase E